VSYEQLHRQNLNSGDDLAGEDLVEGQRKALAVQAHVGQTWWDLLSNPDREKNEERRTKEESTGERTTLAV
jgi:hypothetical protein